MIIPNDLSVGEMSDRAGVPVSTLHFYEAEGLIQSWRTPANHRRYDRRELRRVAIVRVAQSVGIPLSEVREELRVGAPPTYEPVRSAAAPDPTPAARGFDQGCASA